MIALLFSSGKIFFLFLFLFCFILRKSNNNNNNEKEVVIIIIVPTVDIDFYSLPPQQGNIISIQFFVFFLFFSLMRNILLKTE